MAGAGIALIAIGGIALYLESHKSGGIAGTGGGGTSSSPQVILVPGQSQSQPSASGAPVINFPSQQQQVPFWYFGSPPPSSTPPPSGPPNPIADLGQYTNAGAGTSQPTGMQIGSYTASPIWGGGGGTVPVVGYSGNQGLPAGSAAGAAVANINANAGVGIAGNPSTGNILAASIPTNQSQAAATHVANYSPVTSSSPVASSSPANSSFFSLLNSHSAPTGIFSKW